MNLPDRLVTMQELRHNDGERGSRKWVAHNGIVYDVSGCPRWHKEMHENLHFPGQDLTGELPDAPHGEIVFQHPCVIVIGRLE